MPLARGYIQIYTGNGKGKTTAALGLALRAAGAGLRIFIAQFAKGSDTGEFRILRKKFARQVTIRQFGSRSFIKRATKIDCTLASNGLAAVEKVLKSGKHDIIILDELCGACANHLLDVERVCALLKAKPERTELVLTGRMPPKEILDLADLITEMREVRHYFQNGVAARRGIEF